VRVLVTGADGFVGTHLVHALRARGDLVEACGGPGRPSAMEITDPAAVLHRINSFAPEGIVHLAGISSVAWSHQHPEQTHRVNVGGTANLLEAVRKAAPNARVLLVGSGEEYGRLRQGAAAVETQPLSPLSPYAASKAEAEFLGRQAASSQGLRVVLLRPFNHLGRGQSSQFVMPSLARQLVAVARGEAPAVVQVGDLTPVRDFSHVEDVVDAYLLLLARGVSGEIYNVCSGQGLSIREALDTLQALLGTHAEIRVDSTRLRPVEIPWLVGHPGKLERLGWIRRRQVREALRDVLEEALA
jgi:GDP-4-dehydro-6-deoxy-D-mannose reductase